MSQDTATATLALEPVEDWPQLPDGMTLHETPGVAVDAEDRVYLLTRNTDNPVIVLEPDGTFVRTFGAGVFSARTHAIHISADGHVYCADDGRHTITKWTPEGELVLTIGRPDEPAERFSGEPFNRPTDMVVAPDGTIFVTDGYGNARVHHYSGEGQLLHSWGEPGIDHGQFLCPHNLGIDADGRLYVADRESHRVQVFDGAGELVDVWNNIHRPCGLTVGPDGLVYVGELKRRRPGYDRRQWRRTPPQRLRPRRRTRRPLRRCGGGRPARAVHRSARRRRRLERRCLYR